MTPLARRPTSSTGVIKTGRTHLQDATPIRLGQEFLGLRRAGGRAASGGPGRAQAELQAGRRSAAPRSAPASTPTRQFAGADVRPPLRAHRPRRPRDRQPLPGPEHPRRRASPRSGALRHDRAVASPRSPTTSAGWARVPAAASGNWSSRDLQPGSSIMPGKVNPVIVRDDGHGLRPGYRQRRHRRHFRPAGTLRTQHHASRHGRQPPGRSATILANACRAFTRNCIQGTRGRRGAMRTDGGAKASPSSPPSPPSSATTPPRPWPTKPTPPAGPSATWPANVGSPRTSSTGSSTPRG